MRAEKIVISINAAWNIFNFRRGLIRALQQQGSDVVALAPPDDYSARLEELGVEFRPIAIDQQGVSPARDLQLLWRYRQELQHIRPSAFLGFTAKPNIYGSLAAQSLGIPVINNVSGLGAAFITQGLLTHIVSALYRFAFRRSSTVFFQNPEDLELFVSTRIVQQGKAKLLPGSGVNLADFAAPPAQPQAAENLTFLLVARLLRDKGVLEFVEAARAVRRRAPGTRFVLLGSTDAANPTAISRAEVEGWVREGAVEYLGHSDDVRPFIQAADCIVLPSYREGLPRVLLEGAAMGKPLIATDVPGCRQVVTNGQNGLLCAARDADALAQAMLRLIGATPGERRAMGAAGRHMVEQRFDERFAIREYLGAIENALMG